ncbi:MAG: NAD(P)H-dependent oxidoreductase subunit E [Elusimicrobia bacterium]|nr:NAD(P)H-dependent oxidoreductase subunit E [Elusimicrobiota bacterium]
MPTTREIERGQFTPEQETALVAWTKRYPYVNMGLIEALRAVQDWKRQVTPAAAARVAEIFDLPFSHVWGVATFFPTFTQWKTGRHRVGLCHGLSCWMAGSSKMEACLEKTFGTPERATTPDGRLSWETMECLGACEQGPALQVDDRLQGKATEELIAKLGRELK